MSIRPLGHHGRIFMLNYYGFVCQIFWPGWGLFYLESSAEDHSVKEDEDARGRIQYHKSDWNHFYPYIAQVFNVSQETKHPKII